MTTIRFGPKSEKSGELIKRCLQAREYQNKHVEVFKPRLDNRFSDDEVVSRIGLRMKADSIHQDLSQVDIPGEILALARMPIWSPLTRPSSSPRSWWGL